MTPDNTVEQTVKYRGRIVFAMDCVLADAQWRWWPAAQLDRQASRVSKIEENPHAKHVQ